MPAWLVTVLVGLASGLVGTILSTVLRISHERANDLRTRMLDAADDFVTAALEATKALDSVDVSIAWSSAMRFKPEPEIDEGRLHKARLAIKETSDRLPRLRLLYGPHSDAAVRAEKARDAMAEWGLHQHSELQRLAREEFTAESDAPDVAAFDDYIDSFSTAARRQIVGRFNG